jgi:tetratricopeptide (TPR) repeat protein/predicted Ser/Thr protein kinase
MADRDDATLSLDGTGAEGQVPGGSIGRFIVERTLGSGGMGVVVAAHDPTLQRTVAIKLLHAGGDEARERLSREAQAMARVQHPNVATVYEVGAVGEQLFVAMELVDGETLRGWLKAKERAPREVLAMLTAAGRGLAAAHAAGLVHRDFKPDNVLVGSDGRPRVSDFGLVSLRGGSIEGANLRATVSAAGTPAYMSPEQARGELSDARSDQFSFCVTLWEALYRERPFAAEAAPEARHAPERAPRRSGAPSRLAAILSRGMALQPDERWPSMDALLSQLEHDSARRLRRIGLVTLALAGVISLGGWVQSRWSAALRVQRASELSREAQQMRTMMRAARLLPLHDIKPDRDKVRAILKRIESEMQDLSGDERAQAEAALGAGYFAVKDRDPAFKHLHAAWDAGQRSPEVAFDLGQAMVSELQRQQLSIPASRDAEERKRHQEELKRTLRDPALAILHQAAGAADTSPEYLEEVIAWSDRNAAEVEKHGELAFAETPTLYEAGLIAASAWARDSMALQQTGKAAEADAAYEKAQTLYKKVAEIGRSDESVYKLAGDHLSQIGYYRATGGKDHGESLRATLDLCMKGRAADSEVAWPDLMMQRTYMLLGNLDVNAGRDAEEDQKNAIAAGQRAAKRDPKSWMALLFTADVLIDRAYSLKLRGEDPRPLANEAIDSFSQAIRLGGSSDAEGGRAEGHSLVARWEMERGLDSAAEVDATVKDCDSTLASGPPDMVGGMHLMQCRILIDQAFAVLEEGKDARSWIDRAVPLCAIAAKEKAGEAVGVHLPGWIAWLEGVAAAQSGGDPMTAWQGALAPMEAALKADAHKLDVEVDLAAFLADRADYLSAHGRDGKADAARAVAQARLAVADHPKESLAHHTLARALLSSAHAKKGEAAALTEGRSVIEQALSLKKDDLEAMMVGAQLELSSAGHDKSAVARGLALLDRARALPATHPRAAFLRAELEALSGDAARAEATRQEALAAGPQLAAWAKAFGVTP